MMSFACIHTETQRGAEEQEHVNAETPTRRNSE
eukprot:SAG11_NODE_36006_length_263_cov_28.579268_1_plen_32_part_01